VKNQVFKFLRNYSTQPHEVDRLIISAFVLKNKFIVKNNQFLKSYLITENDVLEFTVLEKFLLVVETEIPKFSFEELIQLFEFVVSPADRIVNGAIYTPSVIREYIISQSFRAKNDIISEVKISDIACGCGGFLFNAAKELKKRTNQNYAEIFSTQLYGLDIQEYSINRTKLLLSLLAISNKEDIRNLKFNLFVGDALIFEWKKAVSNFNGFEIILGNPPYVRTRNLSNETKLNLEKWIVCKSGNPDLYIPFFQIGIENLALDGILGFITMNSFFKSLNGRALRKYFQEKTLKFKLIDFGTEQVFKSKNTYTCICLIENSPQSFIKYIRCQSSDLPQQEGVFSKINYEGLDSKKGWNLQDNEIISKIESTGVSFGELYKTRHGIATLKNDIYIFKPVKEDKDYYYLQNGSLYPIEKGICKDIVNSNRLSRKVSINKLKEKVIFPYDGGDKPKLLDETLLQTRYPKAYKYLEHKRVILDQRDKGKGKYENWFAFGRTQSLERMKNKLFFPKISDQIPSYIINSEEDLLFYNGLAIIGSSRKELAFIKKLLESKLFWYYVETTSKPYSSSYFSLNGNYIRNFGVCELKQDEIDYVINESDREVLDKFFERKYGVKIQ
jgi:adenine-specific DNA-methyltransferase